MAECGGGPPWAPESRSSSRVERSPEGRRRGPSLHMPFMTGQPGRFRSLTAGRTPPHADGVTDLGVSRCLDQGGTDLGWVSPTPGWIWLVAFEGGGRGGGGGGGGAEMGGAGHVAWVSFPARALLGARARCDTAAATGPCVGQHHPVHSLLGSFDQSSFTGASDSLALWNRK